ncbi:uncharacterized protein LOC131246794 [Magnolia sinica]|uniref:uncharacterized protein LOC131246794 n=1 Tax=Magnolia sinica TaxID=86752 RepID=UPI00265885B7|nr:uncharacterized protein LOC131246794 [Magnolia sinica]
MIPSAALKKKRKKLYKSDYRREGDRKMAVYTRIKRVTDPLDDRVKACICGRDHRTTGYASSGSEHEAEDSAFLSDLIHGFLEDDAGAHQPDDPEDSDGGDPGPEPTEMIKGLLNPTVDDPFRLSLKAQVTKALDAFSGVVSDGSLLRRAVMGFLRDSGYNAGICKTRWESSGGLTGGSYEFIDAVKWDGATWQRYLIDVGFAGQFEIARPTERYARLLQALPRVYVGRSEELRQIVRLVSDAARKSIKSRGLHLPPWRKNRYMQAKWLGPYRRTLNPVMGKTDCDRFAVKSRSVGFNAVTDTLPVKGKGGCFLLCEN